MINKMINSLICLKIRKKDIVLYKIVHNKLLGLNKRFSKN